MQQTPHSDRRFLFLQGPHGPFFGQLAAMLGRTGAACWRAGFNGGDRAFWRRADSYIAHDAPLDAWPAHLQRILDAHAITDLVLYGDTRPVHAAAIRAAGARGLTVHVFEEGYLRPWWVSYERGGSNGHSRLGGMSIDQMRQALGRTAAETPPAPAHWGDMRQHVFYGALYHGLVMATARRYRHFTTHRRESVAREFRLHFANLALMPVHRASRAIATRAIMRGGFPFHLVLLQLEHDASFRAHSPFASQTEFVRLVLDGFARGAPAHHHLVFKTHPLEDGRAPLRRTIRQGARQMGLDGRVHFVRGGKLAHLLDHARSAVTVNSTAGQQALWRGLPLRLFGDAVYAKPELVSDQPIAEFFAAPRRPDAAAYRDFRQYLLETCQLAGGFYSARGRRQLLRQLVDRMLAAHDPYDTLATPKAAQRQQLRLLGGG